MSFAHTQEYQVSEPPAISPNDSSCPVSESKKKDIYSNKYQNRPTGSYCRGDVFSQNESVSASIPRNTRWHNIDIDIDSDIVRWDLATLACTTLPQTVWQVDSGEILNRLSISPLHDTYLFSDDSDFCVV